MLGIGMLGIGMLEQVTPARGAVLSCMRVAVRERGSPPRYGRIVRQITAQPRRSQCLPSGSSDSRDPTRTRTRTRTQCDMRSPKAASCSSLTKGFRRSFVNGKPAPPVLVLLRTSCFEAVLSAE
jgi:hypothetical protein